MNEVIRFFVGLDVDQESIAIAVADAGREEPRFLGTVGPDPAQLRKALTRIGAPPTLHIVYEAGPSGYELARDLGARGWRCAICRARARMRCARASRPASNSMRCCCGMGM